MSRFERDQRRERLAAAALTGLIAQHKGGLDGGEAIFLKTAAEVAVKLADATIVELDKLENPVQP